LIAVGCNKRNKFAGNGENAGDLGYARGNGFRDCSAEKLGSPATSDRQIGAVLFDALLHILVHASRQTIERDEAANGEGYTKRRENGPCRPALEIAECELSMVQLATSCACTEDCSNT
ncbi:MAG: hypothetical protein WB662_02545, partial [Methyloceanibacter sp.]